MKILLPFQKDLNPYLDEILLYTRHTYHYGNYRTYDPTYKIVNIHWPEAIFGWHEPSSSQLDDLEKQISKWKEKSLLVYTKHDLVRHKGMTPLFKRLFYLIESNSDIFIHLGEYSRKIYSRSFPQARHVVVQHPLYSNSFNKTPKMEAREKLGINPEAITIIAPGQIRNDKERDLVINSFNKLKEPEKVLVVTNMRAELPFDFPGRVRLKKIIDVREFLIKRFKRKFLPPTYYFTYGKLRREDISLKISAADVVLIPRQNILNSGNLFLGLTFGKVVVGPAIGNIKEQLKALHLPVFDPDSISSVTRALEDGIKMAKSNFSFTNEQLAPFHPKVVAGEIDNLFDNSGQ